MSNLLDKPLSADLLINFLESNYSDLLNKKSKGFKTHFNNCQKLLIECKMIDEINKLKDHFGKIKVIPQLEIQEISLKDYLEMREYILSLKGNDKRIESRIKTFNVLSINLIYGYRGSEFWAIQNLNEPCTYQGKVFKALNDRTNKDNIAVLNSYFIVTDNQGNQHKITVKTGNRIAIPMIHPDYPNLWELLGLKGIQIKRHIPIPNANSKPQIIANSCFSWLRNR